MQFAFIDNTGQVMAVQKSPQPPEPTDWELVDGYTRVEVHEALTIHRDKRLEIVDGKVVAVHDNPNPLQNDLPYDELRRKNYPSWGDQLDMLFHSMEQGDFEFTEWRNAIRAVKEEFPKGK